MRIKKITQISDVQELDSSRIVTPSEIIKDSSLSTVIPHDNAFLEMAKALALLLKDFAELGDYPPSHDDLNNINKLFELFSSELKAHSLDPHIITPLHLLKFPNEVLLQHTGLNKALITSIHAAWLALKDIITTINRSKQTTPIKKEFQSLIKKLNDFSIHFLEWKNENIDPLCQLLVRLETELRVRKNHPDSVYIYIEESIHTLQNGIKTIIKSLDTLNGEEKINQSLNDLDRRWPSIAWVELSTIERHRELWLSFLKTNYISIPKMDWDIIDFQLFSIPYDPKSPPSIDVLSETFQTILDFLENEVSAHHVSDIKIQNTTKQHTIDSLFELAQSMINTLCQQIKSEAPEIEYTSVLDSIHQLFKSKGSNYALPMAFKFLLFYGRLFYQNNLKNILESDPALLEAKTIKNERQFFLERPITETNEWIQNYFNTSPSHHRYYPTFARHLILQEIILRCLKADPIQKIKLPEILRWDFTRLTDIQDNALMGISKLVLFRSTDSFFRQHSPESLPNDWIKQLPHDYTISESLDWIIAKTNLHKTAEQRFRRIIKTNLKHDSAIYTQTINRIMPQLYAKIITPSRPFEYHALFPIHDLNMILNYLSLVHKPLFDYHHERFIKKQFIFILGNENLSIPENTPFNLISPMMIKANEWLNNISLALAAMRIARQYIFKRYAMISKDKDMTDTIKSISERLSPLFRSYFSFQSLSPATPTDARIFFEKVQEIAYVYINDVHLSFQRQLALSLYETLKSPSLPKPNHTNIILDSIWDGVCLVYNDINELDSTKKNAALDFLKDNLKLPATRNSFNQLNQQMITKAPPFLSFKFNSNQFLTPKANCFNELLQLVETILAGDFLQNEQYPVDNHCIYRMKNFFQSMNSKLNQAIISDPTAQLIPEKFNPRL